MPGSTIGEPGRSILKIRGSFHWLHFIRRQGFKINTRYHRLTINRVIPPNVTKPALPALQD